MSKENTPIRILTYDAVYGLVDYGTTEYNPDKNEWLTKERCKVCGAAWLAENHVEGHYTCPKCGANKKVIFYTLNEGGIVCYLKL